MPTPEMALRCEKGPTRAWQEDAALVDLARGLAVVADGAGGNQPADKVGPFLLARIQESLRGPPTGEALAAAIGEAEAAYRRAGEADITLRFAGCALAAAWLTPTADRAVLAHVGDCRVWRWREGVATPLTRDHSLVQRMVEMGKLTPEEAVDHPHSGILMRMLCVDDEPAEIEITEIRLRPGDRLLLCTDGVKRAATAAALGAALAGPIEPAAEALMRRGLELDGSDNAALVLIAV